MKTIGIIGGTTWHSTLEYYRKINQGIHQRLGKNHSAKILMSSFDFQEILDIQNANDIEGLYLKILESSKKLIEIGADGILLGANTMHRFADRLLIDLDKPIIHIADATGKEIQNQQIQNVALLGTKITMEENFYKDRLYENFGINVIIPNNEEREYISESIYNDFAKGIFTQKHKDRFLNTIESLINQGAKGVILGCTEIPLLIKQEDLSVLSFDTLQIHAEAVVEFMVS